MKQVSTGKDKTRSEHDGSGPGLQNVHPTSAAIPLQTALGNRNFGGIFREPVGPSGDAFEQEADRASQAVVGGGSTGGGPALTPGAGGIQRKCAACEHEEETIRRAPKDEPAGESASAEAEPQAEAAPQAEEAESADAEVEAADTEVVAAAPSLLVEDDAARTPTQMGKTQFLAALRAQVTATADDALAGTGQTSAQCPWIDYWFGYYADQSAAHLETALRRYAPEAADAERASDYFGAVSARVRSSVLTWSKTGEITGVPEDMPGAGAAGLLSTVGGMFFKALPGGARTANPHSVRNELGSGSPLPGGVRTRMESAFGSSFGGVRLHTDGKAAQLSDQLNARAFTVGQHVAFGSGEYHPGTIGGDALMAHELAHVVQQGGAAQAGILGKSPESTGPLEQDADRSAVSAVSSLWGGVKGAMANAGPSLRSGLQLSRCSKGGSTETLQVKIQPVSIANDDGTAKTTLPSFDAAKRIWKKSCIDLSISAEKTVKKTAYQAVDMVTNNGETAEESRLFAEPDAAGDGIPLFIPANFEEGGVVDKKPWGGGVTHGSGSGDPKIVLVEGVDPTVVGHEIGHAMGRRTHGPAGTVMEPSGAHNKPVAEAVNADITSTVRGFSGAVNTGKKDCSL